MTAMTIMDVMLSMYAVPKSLIKKAAHATLPKNTVNIITKEAANTGKGSSIKICNRCAKRGYCRLEKHIYDAKKAHLAYCDTLVQSQNGFDLTLYVITRINSIVSPRIKKGQSLYHIAKNNESELNIRYKTLGNFIAYTIFTIFFHTSA